MIALGVLPPIRLAVGLLALAVAAMATTTSGTPPRRYVPTIESPTTAPRANARVSLGELRVVGSYLHDEIRAELASHTPALSACAGRAVGRVTIYAEVRAGRVVQVAALGADPAAAACLATVVERMAFQPDAELDLMLPIDLPLPG
jgi:hypothetical protein